MSSHINQQTIHGIWVDIENKMNVLNIKYGDLHLWPLLRIQIFDQLINLEAKSLNSTIIDSPYLLRQLAISESELEKDIYDSLPVRENQDYSEPVGSDIPSLQNRGADALFFCREEENSALLDGLAYNPYLDPLVSAISDTFSCLKIQFDRREQQNQYLHPVFNIPEPLPEFQIVSENEIATKLSEESNDVLIEMNEILASLVPGFSIPMALIVEQIEIIERFTNYFNYILSNVKPKSVLLVCYYYSIGMALIRAAKQLDIPVIDIAHGSGGKFNYPYSHWRVVPDLGYELLPDYFWTWSDRDSENINRWIPRQSNCPLAITGGNPGLDPENIRWFEKRFPNYQEYFDLLRDSEKVVMVALGAEEDGHIPDVVLETIKIAPKNWIWLIRGHPQFYQDRYKVVEKKVSKIAERYEMRLTTNLPLPLILEHCNHVVCGMTSFPINALAVGVPTSHIGQMILEVAPDRIEEKITSYANSAEELLNQIINSNRKPPESVRHLAETRNKIALTTIKKIITNFI